MKLTWTSIDDTAVMARWDDFLQASERGHYAQLSTWLASYAAYGFSVDVLIAEEEGRIVGGTGVIGVGRRPLRVLTVPVGPIIDIGFEQRAAETIVEELLRFTRKQRGAALQMVVPCARSMTTNGTYAELFLPQGANWCGGLIVESATVAPQFLLVNLQRSPDQLMESFRRNHRRNCRRALRLGVEVQEAKTPEELKVAFGLIEMNGTAHGYSTRQWREFGPYLCRQVETGHAHVLVASFDGTPVGVHYGLVAGRRYSYVMGGNIRMSPDLLTGYLLQWKAMTLAQELGLLAYDFTSDGTISVLDFKDGFNPERVAFHEPVHFIASRSRLEALKVALPFVEKHKSLIARIIGRDAS